MEPRAPDLTRRSLLAAGAATAATGLVCGTGRGANAAARRIPYGVAVALDPFRNDPRLREHLERHADVVVPMNALKWASLRHTEGKYDFAGADELIVFAEGLGRPVHGHALCWYAYNPGWVDAIQSPARLERELREHIERTVGRYAGRIDTWDVVNEAVAHDPRESGKWRRGVWYDVLGPRHLDIAFEEAARTDRAAKLFLNDYDLEDGSERTPVRHAAILSMVRRLQDRNIPIHGIGLQAHLYAEREIGVEALHRFLRDLKSLGLEVAVTELDVIDWKLTADPERRDRAVAAVANEFLDALLAVATPKSITTWGMNDAYSWIGDTFPRNDGAKARPLPFAADWTPKPLFDVVRRATGKG